MLIDWFTVGAQLVNFLVLVWLLKRFLYTPIFGAIDARAKVIADRLAQAADTQATASASLEELRRKHQDFDAARAQLLAQASTDAQTEGERLLKMTRATLAAARLADAAELQNQTTQATAQIRAAAKAEIFDTAGKVLSDLASVSVQNAMVEVFIAKLDQLEPLLRAVLRAAFASGPLLILTRGPLGKSLQDSVQRAVNAALGIDSRPEFQESAVVCGIELSGGGQRIAWTIDDYLRVLRDDSAPAMAAA